MWLGSIMLMPYGLPQSLFCNSIIYTQLYLETTAKTTKMQPSKYDSGLTSDSHFHYSKHCSTLGRATAFGRVDRPRSLNTEYEDITILRNVASYSHNNTASHLTRPQSSTRPLSKSASVRRIFQPLRLQ